MEKMRFTPNDPKKVYELVPGTTFECQLAGYPEPVIFWELENLYIFPDNNNYEVRYFFDRKSNTYFVGSRLTITYEPELQKEVTSLWCVAEGKDRVVVEWKVRSELACVSFY